MKGMGFIRAVASVLTLGLYRGSHGRSLPTPPGPYAAGSADPGVASATYKAVAQAARARGGIDVSTFGQSNFCAKLVRKNKLRALGLAGNQR